MKHIWPVYGKHYAPGFSIFTRRDGNLLSDGIVWFQNLGESASFTASHTIMVYDHEWGIEAASRGVRWCKLANYFEDPGCMAVTREPQELATDTAKVIREFAKNQIGRPYDYTGFVLGFPLMMLSGLSKWIKLLRKLPLPFHLIGARVCSAFVADCYKHTEQYCDEELFTEWHVSRITPAMLWNQFPYKPFRFDERKKGETV